MNVKNQIDKADKEITWGLKLKAVNRLRNVINTCPDSMVARETLAWIYYQSGFYDAAGLYWILTETDDKDIKDCVALYEKSVNYSPVQILRDIKYRGDKSGLSDYAVKKLNTLEADALKISESGKKFSSNLNKEITPNEKFFNRVIGSVLIGIAIVFLVGLVNTFKWIWNIFF